MKTKNYFENTYMTLKQRKNIRLKWEAIIKEAKKNNVKKSITWLEYLTNETFIIYDNGGKTLDRYTIVNKFVHCHDIFGSRFLTYECIGSCYTGNSFFTHTSCQRGSFLGVKVDFKNLNNELKNRLINYIRFDNDTLKAA